jgi:gas vesicle protein
MAQLKIDIIVDDNGGEQKVRNLDAALRSVEVASQSSGSGLKSYAQIMGESGAAAVGAESAYKALETRLRTPAWANFKNEIGNIVGAMSSMKGMFAGLAIGAIIDNFVDFTSSIQDMSDRTGIGVRELQRLKYAGDLVGVTFQQTVQAVTQMQNRLAEGDKSAVGAVTRLGFSLDEIKQMDPGRQFELIGSAIGRLPDPMQRTQLAMDVFGRTGSTVMPLLRSEMEQVANTGERLGAIMSEDMVRGGDAIGDSFTILTAVSRNLIGVALLPIATHFAKINTEFERFDRIRGGDVLGGMFGVTSKLLPGDTARVPGRPDLGPEGIGPVTMSEFELKRLENELNQQLKDRQRKAKEAADEARRLADETQRRRDRMTGRDMIAEAQTMMDDLKAVGGLTEITEEATADLARTLGKAIDAYIRLGQVAPRAMYDTWLATTLPQVQGGLPSGIGKQLPLTNMTDATLAGYRNTVPVGSSIAGIGESLALPTAPTPPGLLESAFGSMKDFGSQLSGIIMSSLTGGGDMGKSVGGFLGGGLMGQLGSKLASTLGGTLGGIVGNIFGPLGSMLGSMLGNLVGKIGGAMAKLFGRGDDGDKERDQFQNAMGGSANLYQDLIDAFGQEGRKMFDDLQSANSGKEVTEAADKIQQALEAHAEAIERAMQEIPAAVLSRSQNITSQHDFSTVGGQAMGALQFMIGEGMGPIEALNALTPAINAMREALAAGNIETTAASDRLFYLQDILTQNSVAFQNVAASGSIVSAMFAANHRDAQLFAVSANDIGHNLQSIIDKGVPMSEVFAMSQTQLQSVWMAQKEWGFAVDETTQSLLNQAEQQGFVGEHLKDINQQILDVMLAIAQVLGADIPAYLQQLPGHAQNAATGMQNAFDGIKGPALPGGWTAPSPGDVESMIANLPTSPAYGPNSRTTSGSSQPMVINNVLDGRVLTSVVMEYQAEAVHELGLI